MSLLGLRRGGHSARRSGSAGVAATGTSIGTATAVPRVEQPELLAFNCGGTFSASFGTGTYSGTGSLDTRSTSDGEVAVTGSLILSTGHSALVTTVAEPSVIKLATEAGERHWVHLVLDVTGGSHRFRHAGGRIVLDGYATGEGIGPYCIQADLTGTIARQVV